MAFLLAGFFALTTVFSFAPLSFFFSVLATVVVSTLGAFEPLRADLTGAGFSAEGEVLAFLTTFAAASTLLRFLSTAIVCVLCVGGEMGECSS